ncbi:MAG: hypothetical protein QNK23_03565 [Crocinitomicaceae bacterium]|nr:hypothetical protein [Crocinitomicaceae bacterium]
MRHETQVKFDHIVNHRFYQFLSLCLILFSIISCTENSEVEESTDDIDITDSFNCPKDSIQTYFIKTYPINAYWINESTEIQINKSYISLPEYCGDSYIWLLEDKVILIGRENFVDTGSYQFIGNELELNCGLFDMPAMGMHVARNPESFNHYSLTFGVKNADTLFNINFEWTLDKFPDYSLANKMYSFNASNLTLGTNQLFEYTERGPTNNSIYTGIWRMFDDHLMLVFFRPTTKDDQVLYPSPIVKHFDIGSPDTLYNNENCWTAN